jgi:hypothetical protein
LVALAPRTLNGQLVTYGYVELTLCPALRAGTSSMFTDLGLQYSVDWTYVGGDRGCKVRVRALHCHWQQGPCVCRWREGGLG